MATAVSIAEVPDNSSRVEPAYPASDPRSKIISVDRQRTPYGAGAAMGMMSGTVVPRAGAVVQLERIPRNNPAVDVSVVTIAADGRSVEVLRPAVRMPVSEAGSYITGTAPQVAPDQSELTAEEETPVEPAVPAPKSKGPSLGAMLMAKAPQPEPVPGKSAASDIDPASLGPALAAFMQLLAQNSQLVQQAHAVPPPPPPPPVPVPIPAAVAAAPPTPSTAALAAFETLKIPQLGPEPRAPKSQVDFISKEANFRQTAFYHWVMEEASDLILAADSRYDYPFWAPPNMGSDVSFQVTVHTVEGVRTYTCALLGLNFSFGVFRFYQLVRTDAEHE